MPPRCKHQSQLPAHRRQKGFFDFGLIANFIDAQHVRQHQSICQHMHEVADSNEMCSRKVLDLMRDGTPIAFRGSKQQTKRRKNGVDYALLFFRQKSRGVKRGADHGAHKGISARTTLYREIQGSQRFRRRQLVHRQAGQPVQAAGAARPGSPPTPSDAQIWAPAVPRPNLACRSAWPCPSRRRRSATLCSITRSLRIAVGEQSKSAAAGLINGWPASISVCRCGSLRSPHRAGKLRAQRKRLTRALGLCPDAAKLYSRTRTPGSSLTRSLEQRVAPCGDPLDSKTSANHGQIVANLG